MRVVGKYNNYYNGKIKDTVVTVVQNDPRQEWTGVFKGDVIGTPDDELIEMVKNYIFETYFADKANALAIHTFDDQVKRVDKVLEEVKEHSEVTQMALIEMTEKMLERMSDDKE